MKERTTAIRCPARVGPAPERDRERDRDQHQGGGDLAEADVDAAAHPDTTAPSSSAVGPARRPARRRSAPPKSDIRRACSRSWVTRTSRDSSRSRSSSSVASTAPRGLRVERRGRLVEQQHPGLERQRPRQHHPLLLAHRELRGVALGELGVEPGELEQPARRRARGRRARRRSGCSRRPSPRAAPAAAAPGRPRAAARAGRARGRRRPGSEPARSGSASRSSSRSKVDFPCPTARRRSSPRRDPGAELAQHRLAPPRQADAAQARSASPPCDYRAMATAERMPRNLEPMLATPAKAPPEGEGWAYEIKWDGVRALRVDEGGVRLAAAAATDDPRAIRSSPRSPTRLATAMRCSTARSSPSTSPGGRASSCCSGGWA